MQTFSDLEKESAFNFLGDSVFKKGSFRASEVRALAAIDGQEPYRVRRAAGRIAHRAVNDLASLPRLDWDALAEAVQITPQDENLTQDIACYLRSLDEIRVAIKEADAEKSNATTLSAIADRLKLAVAAATDRYPSELVESLAAAKIASLTDRPGARRLFRSALEHGFVPSEMQCDIGVSTYFDDAELPRDPHRNDEFRQRLTEELRSHADCETIVLLSVDPVFLRHHGAAWFNIAPYLKNQKIGLVFVVAGPKDEADRVIAEARNFISVSSSFHGADAADYSDAAVFVHCDVPSHAKDAKTFYACARYLLLPDVLDVAEKPVLVVDVDMALRADLRPYLAKLRGADFSCPFSRGLPAIYPWRRYMANTVYFGSSNGAKAIAADISRYIDHGLAISPAWTLDQNALSFAVEKAIERGDKLQDANDLSRPLYQEAIRSMFERQSL